MAHGHPGKFTISLFRHVLFNRNNAIDAQVGVILDKATGAIKVNAFKVAQDEIPDKVFQYHIEIFSVRRDGEIKGDDLTDKRVNDHICNNVIYRMLFDLRINPGNGVAYDGGHLIYSLVPLYADGKVLPANCSFLPSDEVASTGESTGSGGASSISTTSQGLLVLLDIQGEGRYRVNVKPVQPIFMKQNLREFICSCQYVLKHADLAIVELL